jgi:hypothetical protein
MPLEKMRIDKIDGKKGGTKSQIRVKSKRIDKKNSGI